MKRKRFAIGGQRFFLTVVNRYHALTRAIGVSVVIRGVEVVRNHLRRDTLPLNLAKKLHEGWGTAPEVAPLTLTGDSSVAQQHSVDPHELSCEVHPPYSNLSRQQRSPFRFHRAVPNGFMPFFNTVFGYSPVLLRE
jgi:hypothetical protein